MVLGHSSPRKLRRRASEPRRGLPYFPMCAQGHLGTWPRPQDGAPQTFLGPLVGCVVPCALCHDAQARPSLQAVLPTSQMTSHFHSHGLQSTAGPAFQLPSFPRVSQGASQSRLKVLHSSRASPARKQLNVLCVEQLSQTGPLQGARGQDADPRLRTLLGYPYWPCEAGTVLPWGPADHRG